MPDDHSEVVPLLPIPNRTVKRFRADDSAGSRVKVGHRQAIIQKTPSRKIGRFSFWGAPFQALLIPVSYLLLMPYCGSALDQILDQDFQHLSVF